MIEFDAHVHTEFSPDCDVPMEKMAAAAAAKGLKKIAFTDHADWLYPSGDMQAPFDIAARRRAYEGACRAYEGRLDIFLGIEIGISDEPVILKKQETFLKELRPDYIVGSLHDYKGEDFYYAPYYEKRDKRKAYEDYFKAMLNSAKAAPMFDQLGHMDYMERYAHLKDPFFRYGDYADIIDRILEELKKRGSALEVNTAHSRYGIMREDEPMIDIAARFNAMGGQIRLGSDAHRAEAVGGAFEVMEGWLVNRGIVLIRNDCLAPIAQKNACSRGS